MHDATSSWNHRGRLGPRQAQQPPKEEAAASPDATTTAARHLELPCTPPQPPPDEKPVAISSTAGPQSVGQALAVIDDESCSTPAIQNALTATVAGLERRIEDNCLSLTKHYLQALIIIQRENLCLLVLHTGSAFDRDAGYLVTMTTLVLQLHVCVSHSAAALANAKQELALDLRTHLATQRTFRRTRAMLVTIIMMLFIYFSFLETNFKFVYSGFGGVRTSD